MKLMNYNKGYKVVSIALNESTKEDLLEDGLDFLELSEEGIILFPEGIRFEASEFFRDCFPTVSNYDVYEIWEDGFLKKMYEDSSLDNYFFVTGKCNSNCIMCPSPEVSRKKGESSDINELIEIAKHIPADAPHLTITGGEPFMVGEKLFEFLQFLQEKFERTQFLILTNGRIFAIEKYVELLIKTIPSNCILGIPIHGSNSQIHDAITQSENSFNQTLIGIKRLLKAHVRVELRIVITKLNVDDIFSIAELIINKLSEVEYVSIMAMEMTGNAFHNKKNVWISYKEAFRIFSNAIMKLIENGIDVKLYNFPLCTVDKEYWSLCEKSISSNKIKYADVCDDCKYKSACGGVFAGTFHMERDELRAIV